MSKYRTRLGVKCTPEEDKLIDSLRRLANNGRRVGAVFGCIQPVELFM